MIDSKPRPVCKRLSSILALGGALALAACVDTAADLGVSKPRFEALQMRPVARPGVSPRGASLALAPVEGAPEQVASRFNAIFSRVAETRELTIVAPAEAAYRVRGYLTAYPKEGATSFAYVWDVFERNGRRAQRLTDEISVKGGGDPWANLDEAALADIAARGADELAAFLSNTPEAAAAVSVASAPSPYSAPSADEGGVTVAVATHPPAQAAETKPLGFAEAR